MSDTPEMCPNITRYDGKLTPHRRGTRDGNCRYCESWNRRQDRKAK